MSSSFFLLLSTGIASVVATAYDTSGKCLEPTNQRGASNRCNVLGSVKKPAITNSFVAYNAQECAQHCFDDGTTSCTSFSFDASTAEGDTNCLLYSRTPHGMRFRQNTSSSTGFFNPSYCYVPSTINDTPVQDGDFSHSYSDPWSTGYYDGDDGTHGAASTHNSYYGSSSGFLEGFYDYPGEKDAVPGSGGVWIEQTLTTCPGMTYALSLTDAYDARFTGGKPGNATFQILVNGEQLYTKTYTTPGVDLNQEPIGPFYFTVSGASTTLRFAIPTPPDPGNSQHADLEEFVDDVEVQSVYRGSLPAGTTVLDA